MEPKPFFIIFFRRWLLTLSAVLSLSLGLTLSFITHAEEHTTFSGKYPLATAEQPIIDVHTGPSRGHPIFHTIEKGEIVEVIDRRTSWLQINTLKGKKGWVHRNAFLSDEERQSIGERFRNRQWEIGVQSGRLDGANAITAYLTRHWTTNISTEIKITQSFDDFFSADLLGINLIQQPFPDWKVSPFFSLGTGRIKISPDTDVVQAEDLDDNFFSVGGGFRIPLKRNFLFRAEYNRYTILTTTNDNQEVSEWKAGFSVFF